jgi:hypothetical protein
MTKLFPSVKITLEHGSVLKLDGHSRGAGLVINSSGETDHRLLLVLQLNRRSLRRIARTIEKILEKKCLKSKAR